MKINKFGIFFFAALVSLSMVSCGSDDDELEKTENLSSQDPEGTIVVNVPADGDSYILTLPSSAYSDGFDYYPGTVRYVDGNLHVDWEIATVGRVNGIGKITKVPTSGWTNSVAAVPGTGYVIRFKGYRAINSEYSDYRYMRVYVVDYVGGVSGGVIGITIKYQFPFEP